MTQPIERPATTPTLPHLVTEIPGPRTRAAVDADRAVTSPSLPRAYPFVPVRGEGCMVEDADGKKLETKAVKGKPLLIVYEDKDASKQNAELKKELGDLAKGDKYKSKIALAAVADLTSYDYWPVKGFVKDAIRARRLDRRISSTTATLAMMPTVAPTPMTVRGNDDSAQTAAKML